MIVTFGFYKLNTRRFVFNVLFMCKSERDLYHKFEYAIYFGVPFHPLVSKYLFNHTSFDAESWVTDIFSSYSHRSVSWSILLSSSSAQCFDWLFFLFLFILFELVQLHKSSHFNESMSVFPSESLSYMWIAISIKWSTRQSQISFFFSRSDSLFFPTSQSVFICSYRHAMNFERLNKMLITFSDQITLNSLFCSFSLLNKICG